jgi:hypothetical protein
MTGKGCSLRMHPTTDLRRNPSCSRFHHWIASVRHSAYTSHTPWASHSNWHWVRIVCQKLILSCRILLQLLDNRLIWNWEGGWSLALILQFQVKMECMQPLIEEHISIVLGLVYCKVGSNTMSLTGLGSLQFWPKSHNHHVLFILLIVEHLSWSKELICMSR